MICPSYSVEEQALELIVLEPAVLFRCFGKFLAAEFFAAVIANAAAAKFLAAITFLATFMIIATRRGR